MPQDQSKSLGLRYVDHDLVPQEGFIGLYEVPGTSRVEKMADAFLRLNIPMSGLRAQTYDGAANMSGRYSGAQAQLKRQPFALFVHYGALS